jgi:hypothetical protein
VAGAVRYLALIGDFTSQTQGGTGKGIGRKSILKVLDANLF